MWGRIAGRLDATAEFAGVDGVEVSIEVPVKEGWSGEVSELHNEWNIINTNEYENK